MKFRTGLVAGVAAYLGARAAAAAIRRVEPGRRLTRALTTRLDAQVDRTVRKLTARAEQGGPVLKGALAGARALAEGKSPARAVMSAVWTVFKETLKGIFGGGRKGKTINIVEHIDIGAPRRMVYDQWTQFQDFPSFMKKVISVNQETDEKLNWTAQIFWSTRSWESTITQQIPDEQIVWQSKGAKGHVDGSVSFHELTPDMTRVLLSLEYHPKGFFEKTANIWRAQGRRVRLELKHFRRHLMTHVITHPEELHGWRGEIRGGQVVGERRSGAQRIPQASS
ncbi:SRPBCC family protein [Actinomadura sp. NPDC047616]|uniref:SRPBCC family protein n=1 Tax=Actinomadura sp. NPDC047616 TaxID=3155914 RepID=UPI0033E884E0